MNIYKIYWKTKKTFFKKLLLFKKTIYLMENDYFINKFIFRNKTSFFIIKRNRDKSDIVMQY